MLQLALSETHVLQTLSLRNTSDVTATAVLGSTMGNEIIFQLDNPNVGLPPSEMNEIYNTINEVSHHIKIMMYTS